MEQTKPQEMDLYQRRVEFTDGYDYENDPAVTLVDLVREAGTFLERIIGTAAVEAGMKHIIGTLARGSDTTWREDLEEGSAAPFPSGSWGQCSIT